MRRPVSYSHRVLLLAVLWIVILLILAEYALMLGYPWRFARLKPYMLREHDDTYVHCAFEAQRVKHDPEAESLKRFVYLGGSAARESITNASDMEKRIEAVSGQKARFYHLASPHRNLMEDANITALLGDFDGTILLPVEPWRFTKNPENVASEMKFSFYLVTDGRFAPVIEKHGFAIPLINRVYLVRSAVTLGEIIKKSILYYFKNDFTAKKLSYDSRYGRSNIALPDRPKAFIDRNLKTVKGISKQYPKHHEFNVELLKVIVETAHANGNRIVLIEFPTNPYFNESVKKTYPQYERMLSEILAEYDYVDFINLRAMDIWDPYDYRDWHHMLDGKKFSGVLAARLTELMNSGQAVKDPL